MMAQSEHTIFYSIEESIKSYRQFAQKQINDRGFDITIDQGLVLSIINENPGIAQKDIARRAFKDHASVTRIIELLVKRNFLKRDSFEEDRRRFNLILTGEGKDILNDIQPIVNANRKKAVEGISPEEIELLRKLVNKITANCKS
ncbi:MarR family transcriptional regulator [Chryseobacterium sp. CKR4-1]|uniref:MarR family winged helix-turn-helix transcriptional regulator n=1 Tax=Chryseobacterium sp. CKR4-1 TaxID=3068896 RepID=UPI002796745F|nr:MarR family transcriptional regulator [Chryseobacterium sp. CKR4-1]MDQ1806239.1 MarR family transcriptional regulator [Chryseobacterium sp. CKR4-1]